MGKKIYAVAPCYQDRGSNFKLLPYKAWLQVGGQEWETHYLPKCVRGFAYNVEFPTMIVNRKYCYLRFVEACTITFDTFPYYIWCETIPMIWDCWPKFYDKILTWLKKHQVKTVIFTSSQTAAHIKKSLPNLNVLVITEGIDVKPYHVGEDLKNRNIDLLEYGNVNRNYFKSYVQGVNHVNAKNANGCMSTWTKLVETMADAKVTVALPRCDTDPVFTGGIETLTQRFWEGMLSRTVMVGRVPKELVDLIGYNPVIDLDKNNPDQQVREIVSHISDYQELVDKNRKTALKMAPWEIRMKKVMEWLVSLGYEI